MRWILFSVITSLFGFYCFVRLFQPSASIHVGDNNVALATVYIDASWHSEPTSFNDEKLSEIASLHNLPQDIFHINVPAVYNAENKLIPAPNNKDSEIRIFDTSLRAEPASINPFSEPYTLRLISVDNQQYWIRDSHMESKLFQYRSNIDFTPISTNWLSDIF